MNITTRNYMETNGDHGRFMVEVSIDGTPIGSVTAVSGPRKDVEAVFSETMTFEEVRTKWGMGT